jgi:hypothetical protein
MPDKLDRWRVAKQFLDRHGRDAESQAERHRQHCVRTLQPDGTAFWVDVVAAIAQLRSTTGGQARAQ